MQVNAVVHWSATPRTRWLVAGSTEVFHCKAMSEDWSDAKVLSSCRICTGGSRIELYPSATIPLFPWFGPATLTWPHFLLTIRLLYISHPVPLLWPAATQTGPLTLWFRDRDLPESSSLISLLLFMCVKWQQNGLNRNIMCPWCIVTSVRGSGFCPVILEWDPECVASSQRRQTLWVPRWSLPVSMNVLWILHH